MNVWLLQVSSGTSRYTLEYKGKSRSLTLYSITSYPCPPTPSPSRPHADNVVRAGLTPKLRDVPTLISMLTYTSAPADAQLLVTSAFGSSSSSKTELFDPPIEEFSVLRTALSREGEKEVHRPIEGPSIMIVTEGAGKIVQAQSQEGEKGEGSTAPLEVKRGDVVFVAADVGVEFEADEEGFVLFRAFVEV